MGISSVATRIGIALDPCVKNFIRSECSVRRNELWAQGCSRFLEDEIIEGLLEDIYYESHICVHQSSDRGRIGLDNF